MLPLVRRGGARRKNAFCQPRLDNGDIADEASIAKSPLTRKHRRSLSVSTSSNSKMTVSRPSFCIGALLFSVFLIAICDAVDLEGRWNEDQYKRTGLHSYLYAIGKK